MGKIRRGRSERKEIKTVTKEYVESVRHRLTPRDVAMLELLVSFPVMTVAHLVTLTPETTLPNGKILHPFNRCKKGIQLCRDRIRVLYDYHFVNKYSPRLGLGEGTAPQYIWLDRAGYRLFDLDGRPPKQLSTEYRHHARILDVYCLFVHLARDGVISIDRIDVCYTKKPKTFSIEPDLIILFRKGRYGYKYFIEVDCCEKKETDEMKKIQKYRDWETSGVWIQEDFANVYAKRFPHLLYIFDGSEKKMSRRIREFERCAYEEMCKADFIRYQDLKEKIFMLPV